MAQPQTGNWIQSFRDVYGQIVYSENIDGSINTKAITFPDGTSISTAPVALPAVPGTSGNELVYNTSGGTAWQSKPVMDVRDYGVDCSFATDSAAALNTLSGLAAFSGSRIVFPPGCHVKLNSTWLIKNQSAFYIGGHSGAGANGGPGQNAATISWCGAAGGTMIDMEYVDGMRMENLTIDLLGCVGGNSALIGINVDKTGAGGTVNTTDLFFERIQVTGGTQTGTSQNNTRLMQFSNVSLSNVENVRVENSSFYCNATTGFTGIYVGPSANAKAYDLHHNNFVGCMKAIQLAGGSDFTIDENLFNSAVNGIDVVIGTTGSLQFIGNRSEPITGGIVLQGAATGWGQLHIQGNEFAVSGRAAATTIDLSATNTSYPVTLIGNYWDALAGEVPIVGNSGGISIVSIGNRYPNSTVPNFKSFQYGAVSLGDRYQGNLFPFQIYSGPNVNFNLANLNTANSGNNYSGIPFENDGVYWTGAASATDAWTWQPILGTGANPSTTYALTHTGSTGAAGVGILTSSLASAISGSDTFQIKTGATDNFGFNDGGGTPWFSITDGTRKLIGLVSSADGAVFGSFSNHSATFRTNNVNRWQMTNAGHLMAVTDNTIDIGASGATRPRTVYAGTSVIIAGNTAAATVASGTSALGTSAIAATTCASVVTTAATGAAATDTIEWAFNAAPGTGYTSGVSVLAYPTTNNVNFLVCNPTAGSLTPAAATLNWRIVR